MDFQILLNEQYPKGGMQFTKNLDIRTSVFLSINTRQGAFFQDPLFGSKLYKITRVTNGNIALAKQYVEQSVQWLLDTGRAKTITVIVEKDSIDIYRINIKVTVTQSDGLIITFQQYRPVGLGSRTDYYIQDGSNVSAAIS